MFVMVPRSTSPSYVPSKLVSISLWTHVAGIPFDLMTQEGLCFVVDAMGLPKQMDDYTKNLTSHSRAHIGIEADLTKPLPNSLELEREDGNVITCGVTYPWIPLSCSHCSHCKKMGHIIRYCHRVNQQWVPVTKQRVELGKDTIGKTSKTPNTAKTPPHLHPLRVQSLNKQFIALLLLLIIHHKTNQVLVQGLIMMLRKRQL